MFMYKGNISSCETWLDLVFVVYKRAHTSVCVAAHVLPANPLSTATCRHLFLTTHKKCYRLQDFDEGFVQLAWHDVCVYIYIYMYVCVCVCIEMAQNDLEKSFLTT